MYYVFCPNDRKPKNFLLGAILLLYFSIFFVLNFFFEQSGSFLGIKLYYFLYTLLEYLTLTFIFYYFLDNRTARRVIVALTVFFVVFLICFYLIVNIKRLDSFPIGIESIIVLVYTVLYFYNILKTASNESIIEKSSFWFIIGILIYISFTFFFNILANSLDREIINSYFHYSYLGDILKNILFTIGIYFLSKEAKSVPKKDPDKVPFLDMY